MKQKFKELKVGDSEVIRVKNREGSKVSFRAVRIKLRNDKLKYRVQCTEPIKGNKKRIAKTNGSTKGGKSNLSSASEKRTKLRLGLLPCDVTLQKATQFYLDGVPAKTNRSKKLMIRGCLVGVTRKISGR
jgi:hypothetical protein